MMGAIHRGVPKELALNLRDEYNLRFFIETGTLWGLTAEWATTYFDQVYTVEIAYKFYIAARAKLSQYSNVQVIYGYSKDVLAGLLPVITDPCLLWLDAHWSRDLGYEQSKDTICPLLDELAVISKYDRDHVVLIDDLRLFGKRGWPKLERVTKKLERMNKLVSDTEDVVVAIPNGKT